MALSNLLPMNDLPAVQRKVTVQLARVAGRQLLAGMVMAVAIVLILIVARGGMMAAGRLSASPAVMAGAVRRLRDGIGRGGRADELDSEAAGQQQQGGENLDCLGWGKHRMDSGWDKT